MRKKGPGTSGFDVNALKTHFQKIPPVLKRERERESTVLLTVLF